MVPQLQFHEAGRALFVHVLRPGRTVIGRSDRCDVALPSESISRVHCVIEGRNGVWRVLDRSRHGIQVNGAAADDVGLADGDEIAMGIYHLRFNAVVDRALRSPTATAPVITSIHEELMEGTEAGLATARAQLRGTRGPLEGQLFELKQARVSVGGPGAMIELDAQLPTQALFLRVVRGRPMVEAGSAAVFLAGTRVREVTPLLAGEEVRVGAHGFVVELATATHARELDTFGEMVGTSAAMRRLFGSLSRMAAHDAPVLLMGASGTGKELAARGLHTASPSCEGPFVALNCAAIADGLFESELFGHEKGAFTGAVAQTAGAFHHADGGTLFLDEIGEMRLELQAKLLRTLESGEVRRVGSHTPNFPDVRVIAATNRNLAEMVREGAFREDLYWRLAVLTVRLPTLKERPEDIPLLAETLLERTHPGAALSPGALEALTAYAWPGNVRELRNVLTRAYVMAGDWIGAGDLSFNPWSFDGAPPDAAPPAEDADPDRRRIVDALAQCDDNRTRAARLLGIPRSTLLYKLEKYGLKKKRRPKAD